MKIEKCTMIYFSPTNTTKKVLLSIAKGLNPKEIEIIDLNKYDRDKSEDIIIDSDIVIIGAPVYGGRIVKEAQKVFERIKGNNQMAVLAAVYGNMSPGIAIEQLYDISVRRGLRVVAMGTFIGEHSFCTKSAPVGQNRPDDEDIRKIEFFGSQIKNKIINSHDLNGIVVSPNFMKRCIARVVNGVYKVLPQKAGSLVKKLPIIDTELCNECGICVKNCPMNAISDDFSIDNKKCIRCFRCVKNCPKNARKIEYRFKSFVTPVFGSIGKAERKIKTIV